MKRTAIPARTRESVAACSALGLSYWADGPRNGTVWAADPETGKYSLLKVERAKRYVSEIGVFNGLTTHEVATLEDPVERRRKGAFGTLFRDGWLSAPEQQRGPETFVPETTQWQLGLDV